MNIARRIAWALSLSVLAAVLVYALRGALVGLVIAFVIAYLLDPIIDRFEHRGLSRSKAILLCVGLASVAFALLILLMIPLIGAEARVLSGQIDGYATAFWGQIDRSLLWLSGTFGVNFPADSGALRDLVAESVRELDSATMDPIARVLGVLGASTLGMVGALVNLLLVPVYAFYLLRDFDDLKGKVHHLLPLRWQDEARTIYREVNELMGRFLRGQLMICACLAVLYTLGLVLFARIDMAVLVGVTSGILFIVPYLGTAFGIVVASALSLLKWGVDIHLVAVLLTFGLSQLVEGMLLTPRILGDSTGLHPIVVILALIVGASLFGVLGMLLAVPVAAAGRVLAVRGMDAWVHSQAYLGPENLDS